MSKVKEERVTDLSIIMEMIDSKPYYSVQYRNVGENGYNIGYSSYNLKEELVELITGSLNFDCADYCDSFTQGCAFNCNKKDREIALKWLQSEAE